MMPEKVCQKISHKTSSWEYILILEARIFLLHFVFCLREDLYLLMWCHAWHCGVFSCWHSKPEGDFPFPVLALPLELAAERATSLLVWCAFEEISNTPKLVILFALTVNMLVSDHKTAIIAYQCVFTFSYTFHGPASPTRGGEISLGKRKGKVWVGWCLEVFLACHEFPVSHLDCSGARQCCPKERGKSFGQVYSRRWNPV